MVKYSDNAQAVYERLYLARNYDDEVVESIEDCHDRVADFTAESGDEYIEFKRLLDHQSFRPNTPAMASAGLVSNPMMLACFVLGLDDSMDSIQEMWATCSRIYQGGGGAGIPATNLRRRGGPLSTGGAASGPAAYLDVVAAISGVMKSGSKQRAAANMIMARYDHPDLYRILDLKRDEELRDRYSSMNLSVAVDDGLMEEVRSGAPNGTLTLWDPNEGIVGKFDVMELWDTICQSAHQCADPGLFFMDRANRDNPLSNTLGDIESTNPCGEVPLWPWSCCCLGHMNLARYVDADGWLDHGRFTNDIYWAVLFLNRLIDKTSYPNPKFQSVMQSFRPIGLGVMGFADMLHRQGIAYGSRDSVERMNQVSELLTRGAFGSSARLVHEGIIPPVTDQMEAGDRAAFADFVGKFAPDLDGVPGNVTVTCFAPTGSTAISADCSMSAEPAFSLIWTKWLDGGDTMRFVDGELERALDRWIARTDLGDRDDKQAILDLVEAHGGRITEMLIGQISGRWGEAIADSLSHFTVAHDVDPMDRLKVQAAAQDNLTMAISSTVNLPSDATVEDISRVYLEAWRLGLKGITVYRDGCLEEQPVQFGSGDGTGHTRGLSEHDDATGDRPSGAHEHSPGTRARMDPAQHGPNEQLSGVASSSTTTAKTDDPNHFGDSYQRPMERDGKVYEIGTPGGKLYVRGSFDRGHLMEVFLDIGQQGSRENVIVNGLGRVISRSLQRGVRLSDITDTLRGSGGDTFFLKLNGEEAGRRVDGILDAVATILDEKFNLAPDYGVWPTEPTPVQDVGEQPSDSQRPSGFERCPECRRFLLRRDAGCRGGQCMGCGYSNCS